MLTFPFQNCLFCWSTSHIYLHAQIMCYAVACIALRIFLVYCRIVRRIAMTILAGHEFFVNRMTFCACQFRMFGLVGLKVFIWRFMASSAYQIIFYLP